MRLDEFLEGFERDEAAERRRLAREKSYEITNYLEDFERQFEDVVQGDSLFGSTAPSIFVGHANYPTVSTGLLSPVGNEERAADFVTTGDWYERDYGISDVFERRTGLLNSNQSLDVRSVATDHGIGSSGSLLGRSPVDDTSSVLGTPAVHGTPSVHDVWDGFVGVQREVAIADRPVDVEIGLAGRPKLDIGLDDVAEPNGPRARARSADLAENPHVPKPIEKTLSDDDWRAEGAMAYLYRRGFDVYEINRILSAGALGESAQRRLVPTRWSITAVDDTIGNFLRGGLRNAPSVDTVEVWANEYVGNRYWVILAPGRWEYELVEMKAPGSIWNPDPAAGVYVAADYEGSEGRTQYVDGGTAGAYYAARLGVLEHLTERGRQAKVLVLRHVSDEYWGPVGVWQIRESVGHAFEGERGEAETFHDAVAELVPHLPISMERLRRSSEMASGLQVTLSDFG